ncbi:MAG: hypothetical protein AB8H03_23190 [Saprospiraceae bacterium]
MKNNIKLMWLTLFFLSLCLTTIAQKRNFSISPTIGLNIPILDNGSGFHIGINPAFSVSSRFAIECQFSYAYVKVNDSFISGESGSQENFNALLGGRFYLLSDKKKIRPYFNLLLGGTLNRETDYEEYLLGVSTGFFVDFNRLLAGLSFETPGNIILKIGYAF